MIAEKRDGLVVQQRRVRLHAEAEIARKPLDAREDGFAVQQRLGPVEDDLRQRPLGDGRAEVSLQRGQGLQQALGGHVFAAAAHPLGDVAVGAIEVAPLRRIEIDRRRLQAESQGVHLRGELGGLLSERLREGPAEGQLGELFPADQGPKRGVRLDHGDVIGVADVDGLEGGAIARADVAAPGRGRRAVAVRRFRPRHHFAFLSIKM